MQRHGKISAAFAVLCSKPAAEEDCHASRIVILLGCSSTKDFLILEDAAVGRVGSASEYLRLPLLLAKSGIWYRDYVA